MLYLIITIFQPIVKGFVALQAFFCLTENSLYAILRVSNGKAFTMGVLYFFESIRNPVLDVLVQAVTLVGEETFFLALGLFLIWCSNKRDGYLVLMVSFTGIILNQFLKMCFRVPRPWVKDPNFTIVESAREGASGYSFPSGHTQNSVGMLGSLGITTKHLWVRILCIAGVILVPLSGSSVMAAALPRALSRMKSLPSSPVRPSLSSSSLIMMNLMGRSV